MTDNTFQRDSEPMYGIFADPTPPPIADLDDEYFGVLSGSHPIPFSEDTAKAINMRHAIHHAAKLQHIEPTNFLAGQVDCASAIMRSWFSFFRRRAMSFYIVHLVVAEQMMYSQIVSLAARNQWGTALGKEWTAQGAKWSGEWQRHLLKFFDAGLEAMKTKFGDQVIRDATPAQLKLALGHYFDVDPLYAAVIMMGPFKDGIDLAAIFQPGADPSFTKWAEYIKYLFVEIGIIVHQHYSFASEAEKKSSHNKICYDEFKKIPGRPEVRKLQLGDVRSIPIPNTSSKPKKRKAED